MADELLDDQFAPWIGRPLGSLVASEGPDPVNQPMIRHWVAAFEDANPVYVDSEAAGLSRFAAIVAPPLMLQTWTMATPLISGIRERGGSPVETQLDGPLGILDSAGYVATVATDSEFEIVRYLGLGERVSAATVLEAVSEDKTTRLGKGRFVTWLTTYTVASGEVVGRQRFRILKFIPDGPS